MHSSSKKVGTGSSEHDLVGDAMMIRRSSTSVNGSNDTSDDTARDKKLIEASPIQICIYEMKWVAEQLYTQNWW